MLFDVHVMVEPFAPLVGSSAISVVTLVAMSLPPYVIVNAALSAATLSASVYFATVRAALAEPFVAAMPL